MNYTKTYHLPQWKPEDRILMADFNNAMASIEKGLAAADKAGFLADEMSRDLYRQIVQCRVHHGHGGRTDAMWVNALASLEDAGGEGHGWNGRYGVYHGNGGLPTMEGIMALGPQEEAQIDTTVGASGTDRYSLRAAVTFTSNGCGMLDEVKLWAHRSQNYSARADFTFTLTRLDTGEAIVSDLLTQPADSPSRYWVHAGLPLEPSVSYRLEYTIVNENSFTGWAGFSLATTKYTEKGESLRFAAREAEPTITNTVTPPERATGAIGIVRWRGDGTAALTVNGQTLPATRTRDGLNALGAPCTETEFLLESIPQEAFELTLVTEKGEGDLDIYDYGIIWR